MFQALRLELANRRHEVGVTGLLPGVGADARDAVVADTHVQREHDALGAERAQPACDGVRLAHGEAADDDARRAGVEQRCDVLALADAAANLNLGGRRRDHAPDQAAALRFAGLCAVQVDDVQRTEPEFGVACRKGDRIGVIAGLLIVIAVQQTHAAALAKVDRRDDTHRYSARKLASSRAPGAADRSGWNCVP